MRPNDIIHSLRSTFDDWSPQCLANPRFARGRNNTIAWSGHAHQRLDHIVLASDIARLTEAGQYTYQTTMDGSLFQIFYQFNSQQTTIINASLAFYSSQPQIRHLSDAFNGEHNIDFDRVDLDTDDKDSDDVDSHASTVDGFDTSSGLSDGPVGWLRIDYAPHQAHGVLHYDCHMHVSLFPDSRIAVAGLPSPRQFVEFVIALCYPEYYRNHRLDTNGHYIEPDRMRGINAPCMRLDSDIFRHIAHVRIPMERM